MTVPTVSDLYARWLAIQAEYSKPDCNCEDGLLVKEQIEIERQLIITTADDIVDVRLKLRVLFDHVGTDGFNIPRLLLSSAIEDLRSLGYSIMEKRREAQLPSDPVSDLMIAAANLVKAKGAVAAVV